MSDRATLVLHTGKAAVDRARADLVEGMTYLDVHEGAAPEGALAVPAFAPEAATLAVTDRLMARHPFEHVVATSESNVAFAAFLRGRYGLPGPTTDQVLPATNKWRMKQLVAPAFPTAACRLSGDLPELVRGWPADAEVVVKPLSGSSTKGVRRVSVPAARDLVAGGEELLLVEEALDVDEELHVDGVVSGGRLRVALPSVYNRPVLATVGDNLMSIHLPETDPRHAEAVAAADRITACFAPPDFVFHLELLRCGDRLLFGELGMRPAGGGRAPSLARFCGADLWRDFLSLQMGLSAPSGDPHPPVTHCGMVGLGVDVTGRRRVPSTEEIRAVPGVVDVEEAGGTRAHREAAAGSSVAYTHVVFLAGPDDAAVRATGDAVRLLQEP